jgi:hypothetical protein
MIGFDDCRHSKRTVADIPDFKTCCALST